MSPGRVIRTVAAREWLRFLRQPIRVVATIVTPLIFLVALGGGFAGALSSLSEGGYAGFLLPGLIAMAALFAGAFASISLIEDRDSGPMLAVLAGPSPKWAVGLGKAVGVGVLATAQALVLLLAVPAVGLRPTPTGWLAAIAGTVLLCIGVVGCSQAIAWRCRDASSFHAVMNIVLLPGWMLSGAFYPAEQAADAMRLLTLINPLSWPVGAIRGSLTGDDGLPGPWQIWWIGASVFGLAGVLLASVSVRPAKDL